MTFDDLLGASSNWLNSYIWLYSDPTAALVDCVISLFSFSKASRMSKKEYITWSDVAIKIHLQAWRVVNVNLKKHDDPHPSLLPNPKFFTLLKNRRNVNRSKIIPEYWVYRITNKSTRSKEPSAQRKIGTLISPKKKKKADNASCV